MELPDEEYPMKMMTGRVLYHYNACAMTDKTEGLNEISGHSFIEINTEDAERIGIKDGDRVKYLPVEEVSRRQQMYPERRIRVSAGCRSTSWMVVQTG